MFMDDRILWCYKTRILAGHMTTSAGNSGELSGRAVLLRADLQPRGGKKRQGPDENNCFCCYLATTDRHMLYIALSIANWCSVMTTTRIRALKVYLTRYPASKFKDVFAQFTWQRVTREEAFSCCESATTGYWVYRLLHADVPDLCNYRHISRLFYYSLMSQRL